MEDIPLIGVIAADLLTELDKKELDSAQRLRTLCTMFQCFCLAHHMTPEDHKNMLQALVHDYSYNYCA